MASADELVGLGIGLATVGVAAKLVTTLHKKTKKAYKNQCKWF